MSLRQMGTGADDQLEQGAVDCKPNWVSTLIATWSYQWIGNTVSPSGVVVESTTRI
jgi:hypothetical protein